MIYTLSRRNFIALAAGMLVHLSSLTGHAARNLRKNSAKNPLMEIYSNDLQAARLIGRAYLRETPNEADADLLFKLIVKGDPILGSCLNALSNDQHIAILRKRISQDFDLENTVYVDGWVLSRTEARLCALCALL